MSTKKYVLSKRFSVALSEQAYTNLRALNKKYGYGNNYLLTVLLENIDTVTNPGEVQKAFKKFEDEYGSPVV